MFSSILGIIRKSSLLLALGTKVLVLTAFAAILFSASLSIGVQTSYAQFEPSPSQQQEQQGAGEQQVESDGGLTATLNGETFGRGDTVSVSGTVEERDGSASMYATIIDPDGIELGTYSINVGSDMTFRYGFVAGEDISEMTKAGTYTVQIQYFPPGNADEESLSLDFEYNPEAVLAPQTEQGIGTEGTTTEPTTTFQNLTEGFRIQVPNGWVADDGDISDSARQQFIQTNGFEFLGAVCPQEQALPMIGGLFDCRSAASEGIEILAYPNLSTRPEFARIINQNQNITLNDLIALDIEEERKRLQNAEAGSRISIAGQTETVVNVVDAFSNQTVQALPAREVVYGLPAAFGDEINVKYVLLILADNGNIGYRVAGILQENIQLDDGMPTFVRQAFNSFELLAANSSQLQQPMTAGAQQQSQQNNTTTTSPFSSNSTISTNSNATAAKPTQLKQQNKKGDSA